LPKKREGNPRGGGERQSSGKKKGGGLTVYKEGKNPNRIFFCERKGNLCEEKRENVNCKGIEYAKKQAKKKTPPPKKKKKEKKPPPPQEGKTHI